MNRPTLRTAFTDLVGCAAPIQLAPMGGDVVTVELATAVCRAGGFGMLNRRDLTPLQTRLEQLEGNGAEAYGVSFTVTGPSDAPEQEDVEQVARRVRLVEFFWASPRAEWVAWVKAAGCLAGWQVGSLDEALRAVDAGCDVIAVQGLEAGGHVRGGMGLLPLLSEVLDRVDVPVLAAGGIATARSMAAVLAAGASGVRVGTRFLATYESGAHPAYVEALLAADGDDTLLTEQFSIGWPGAPHRVLTAAAEAARLANTDVVGRLGGRPLPRFSAQVPGRGVTGEVGAMAQYAGQGVGAVREVVPAEQVVRDMTEGASALLGSRADA